jgi:glyoxylase-like metal-dependent hydrolase (beta-lactamase superfamily II)
VLYDETGECAIVDPGCHKASEQKQLSDFIENNKLRPVLLLNTHCHIDHVLGNPFVSRKYQLSLHLHREELKTYSDTGRWAQLFGMVTEEIPSDRIYIDDGDELKFGNTSLLVLLTPGHSIASVSFYHKAGNQLISGDVLFYESIGRTDLPGGDFQTLISSIRTRIFTLPDHTVVYCGHGPSTTVAHEKEFNSFLR